MKPDPDRPAEIVSIGTEVVLGRIQDTNASWLAENLAHAGANVRRITGVPDTPDEVRAVLADAVARRTGLVVSTGGLGPTPDDMTVATIAAAAGCGVTRDPDAVANYRQRRDIPDDQELPPNLEKMATVPETAAVFINPVGWAPGFMVPLGDTVMFAMPGPPREMKGVYEAHLGPLADNWYAGRTVAQRLRVEMFESQVSPLLEEAMNRYPNAYLKAYVALGDGAGLPIDVVVRRSDGVPPAEEMQEVIRFFGDLVRLHGKEIELID
ncbi:MAG: competence/damage-inducible protein A [Chloroflexota bacterium]|nr:competence/damage-inducible protein A [Chloroflexota bacterium]